MAYALERADWPDVTALGTDGTDGPPEFAGGLVDSTIVPSGGEGVDPWTHLQRHNASEPLALASDAARTGATGTNVMNLRLVLIAEGTADRPSGADQASGQRSM
jgi:glycerate-2-kinase